MVMQAGACAQKPLCADLRHLASIPLQVLPVQPTVSVLISCYNYGAFVGQAIDSILEQSYGAIEIIVSDDGSQDDSCAVVESYIDRGVAIKLLRNPHGGMAATLNAAYRHATGEVICLLDADDTYLPAKIATVVAAFQNQPAAGFAIHRAHMVDQRQRTRGVYPLLAALPSGDCAQQTYDNAGILMGLPPTTNLSFRREVGDRIFPIPVEYTGYAEQTIQRMAPLMTEVSAIDAPLARWRMHGQNDQNAKRMTAKRLTRELAIMQSLWFAQKSYLDRLDAALGQAFPKLETTSLYLKMEYMRHRLNNDPEMHQAHDNLCRYGLQVHSKLNRFWRHSKVLPLPLFQKAIDLLHTQSVLKEMVSRAVRGR